MTSGTFYLLLITVVLAVAMSLAFSRARIGMNATALREDPVAASAIGISPHRTGVLLGAAGGMAAVAGFLLTPIVTLSASALTLLVIPGMASALLGRLSAHWLDGRHRLAAWSRGVGPVRSAPRQQRHRRVASVRFAVIIVAVVLGGRAPPGRGESLTIRLPRGV